MSLRGLWLFVLPIPLFWGAFFGMAMADGVKALGCLAAFAVLEGGAWLNRQGERAAVAYETRKVANPPALPRKLIAAGLSGLGVATATLTAGAGGLSAVLLGAIATGAHVLSFGIDPIRAKGVGTSHAEAARVAGALDRAHAKIAEIEGWAHGLRDREIEVRIGRMLDELRAILRQIEADPRDLPRARRYLSVYLDGAHAATAKYAANHRELDDPKLRRDYLDLLGELERSFGRGRETLLLEDRSALEIEIEVLRERLAHET